MAQSIWLRRRPRRIDDEVVATGIGLELVEYWRSVLRDRTMPARRDIDPVDLNRLLPAVFLINVHTDPLRFRWRLVGTRIGDVEHREYTGKWLDETVVASEDPFLSFCELTIEECRPTCHVAERSDVDGGSRPLLRCLAPLSEDGITANMLLGVVDYNPPEIQPVQRETRLQAGRPALITTFMPTPQAVPR
jgi:hypothetical protein